MRGLRPAGLWCACVAETAAACQADRAVLAAALKQPAQLGLPALQVTSHARAGDSQKPRPSSREARLAAYSPEAAFQDLVAVKEQATQVRAAQPRQLLQSPGGTWFHQPPPDAPARCCLHAGLGQRAAGGAQLWRAPGAPAGRRAPQAHRGGGHPGHRPAKGACCGRQPALRQASRLLRSPCLPLLELKLERASHLHAWHNLLPLALPLPLPLRASNCRGDQRGSCRAAQAGHGQEAGRRRQGLVAEHPGAAAGPAGALRCRHPDAQGAPRGTRIDLSPRLVMRQTQALRAVVGRPAAAHLWRKRQEVPPRACTACVCVCMCGAAVARGAHWSAGLSQGAKN